MSLPADDQLCTDEQLWAIAAMARSVAAAPPPKPSSNAFSANVPWSRIVALRAALDAAGIEWRDRR